MKLTKRHSPSPMDRPLGRGIKNNLTEKISKDELIDIVKSHGYSIGMLNWEVNLLTDICVRRRCLWKGLEILLEYTKLQSDIDKFIRKRSSYRDKVMYSLQDRYKLPSYIEKMAEYSLKTWISVLRLRLMQWSPRPINISSEPVVSRPSSNFLFEFNKDIRLLITKIKEGDGLNLVECGASVEHMIIVLSTAAVITADDWTALFSLIERPLSVSSASHSPADIAIHMKAHSNFLSAMETAIKVEIASENTVNAFASLSSTRIELLEADKLPLLRIQYGAVPPPSLEGERTSEEYYNACHTFLDLYYEVFTNYYNRDRTEENDSNEAALLAMAEINSMMVVRREGATSNHKLGVTHKSRQRNGGLLRQQRLQRGSRPRLSPSSRHRQAAGRSTNRSPSPPGAGCSTVSPVTSLPHRITVPVPADADGAVGAEYREEKVNAYYSSGESWPGEEALGRYRPLESLHLFPRAQSQPNLAVIKPSLPRKVRYVDVTVGLLGSRDIMLHIERVRANVHTYRLVVMGYLEGCSASTRKVVKIGDEVVGVNGVSVVGDRTKRISQLIREGVEASPAGGPGSSRHVILRLRRFYEGWEQFVKHVAVTSASVSAIINIEVTAPTWKPPRKACRVERAVPAVSTPRQNIGHMSFAQLEFRVNELRQDVVNVDKLIHRAHSAKVEKLKTVFIEKYEEMVACEQLIQKLSRSKSDNQRVGMFASNLDIRAADSEDNNLGGEAVEALSADLDVPQGACVLDPSAVCDSVVSDVILPKQMDKKDDVDDLHQQSFPAVATVQVTLKTNAECTDDRLTTAGWPQTDKNAEASGISTALLGNGQEAGLVNSTDVNVDVGEVGVRDDSLRASYQHSAERAAAAAAAIIAFTVGHLPDNNTRSTAGNDDEDSEAGEGDELYGHFQADVGVENVDAAADDSDRQTPVMAHRHDGDSVSQNPNSTQSGSAVAAAAARCALLSLQLQQPPPSHSDRTVVEGDSEDSEVDCCEGEEGTEDDITQSSTEDEAPEESVQTYSRLGTHASDSVTPAQGVPDPPDRQTPVVAHRHDGDSVSQNPNSTQSGSAVAAAAARCALLSLQLQQPPPSHSDRTVVEGDSEDSEEGTEDDITRPSSLRQVQDEEKYPSWVDSAHTSHSFGIKAPE